MDIWWGVPYLPHAVEEAAATLPLGQTRYFPVDVVDDIPDFFPGLICSTCAQPLRVCLDCWRIDWWYLHCPKPHCRRTQHSDYDHKHDYSISGERRYRWERARKSDKVGRHSQNSADAAGRVRVRIFLVDTRGAPGTRRSGHLVLGNVQRTLTLREGRVSEVATAIESLICEVR